MAQLPSSKRRKLSPPGTLSSRIPNAGPVQVSSRVIVDEYLSNASRWNLEQDYETRPRKAKAKEKENTRLPIKTAEGRVEALEIPKVEVGQDSDDSLEIETEEDGLEEPAVPLASHLPIKHQIMQAKEEMAQIASLINVDPEEHINGLKRLAALGHSSNATIKKLALATQMVVYKDIIPGYRIRPLTDADLAEKVSQEVRKARAFEQGIVGGYQAYVNELAKHAKDGRGPASKGTGSLSPTAIVCACTLLLAVPHFNFRGELLKIIIDKLSRRRVDDSFRKCVSTLEKLFEEDDDGNPSREAVAMLTRMIKTRDYHIDESVLNTFLHLRLLREFSSKASQNGVDRSDPRSQLGKKPKQKREFRTKKQRKSIKELKAVEKEFREADAGVQHEERERMQAEMLKLVFGTYFRILKARSPKLMGAVLEGLAKFTHLINQEFFGDLLITLQDLANQAVASVDAEEDADGAFGTAQLETPTSSSSNPYRTALLCATTAFALLSAQEAASLQLDLSYFTRLLHEMLVPLAVAPELELSTRTLRLADPHAPSGAAPPTKVNATTLSTLLMRALTGALTPRGTPPARLAAFVHRLMMFALHAPEKTGLATVVLLRELVRNQGRKVRQLWNTEERRGDGKFDPLGGMDASRPFCGTVWEGELLRRHYALGVKAGLGELEALVKDFA